MKRLLTPATFVAVFFAFTAALTLPAFAQSDAMPPETKAPADMHHEKAPVPPSKSLTVVFHGKITTLTIDDLLSLPQVTVTVHNTHRNADESYTGPLVSDVLAKAGLVATKETEPMILHASVVATGTDKYFVVYSAAEMQPGFATGKVIVAVMKTGLPNTEGGLIQLTNTADAKPARWVHGLSNLNVMSLEPTK